MAKIIVLDQNTVNQIAAGEVIERPVSVVKELVENAIDADATAITVEIKEGGTSLIRITDNGSGIEKEDVPQVFVTHATSKIKTAEDLLSVKSLGFRGEALASISSVSKIELLTKVRSVFSGSRYQNEGGECIAFEEIGCPDGTTFLIRDLFYNTPARKKFLKTSTTEASYCNELIERLALSNQQISFKFINNNKTLLQTNGNKNLKEVIYGIYGREIASSVVEAHGESGEIKVTGFVGKPEISRGNRNYENYFINGRYIRNQVICRAIEDAYKTYVMQHKFPFTALNITIPSEMVDVNVHPAKLEVRFTNGEAIYLAVYQTVKAALAGRDMVRELTFTKSNPKDALNKKVQQKLLPKERPAEPFEEHRRAQNYEMIHQSPPPIDTFDLLLKDSSANYLAITPEKSEPISIQTMSPDLEKNADSPVKASDPQLKLFELNEQTLTNAIVIGQLFNTYWLVEYNKYFYIIDQHAAHERILYESMMKRLEQKIDLSQMISPPIVLTLSVREEIIYQENKEELTRLGYQIESFGGKEFALSALPVDLYGADGSVLFIELLEMLAKDNIQGTPDIILQKLASMSCKAAVKANQKLSKEEAYSMIQQLLTLENPFHCPHGRPITISMSKLEIEKEFKRIL